MLLGWRMTAGMAFRNHVARRFHISARRIIAGAQKHGRKWEGKKSERGEIGKKSNRETWTSCHNFRSNQRFSKSSRKIKLSFLCKVCNDSYQIRERESPQAQVLKSFGLRGREKEERNIDLFATFSRFTPYGSPLNNSMASQGHCTPKFLLPLAIRYVLSGQSVIYL